MTQEPTAAEYAAHAERIAQELEHRLAQDIELRARLLEIFGMWVVSARARGGRPRWDMVIEGAFPWPTEAEVETAFAAARKRLGVALE